MVVCFSAGTSAACAEPRARKGCALRIAHGDGLNKDCRFSGRRSGLEANEGRGIALECVSSGHPTSVHQSTSNVR